MRRGPAALSSSCAMDASGVQARRTTRTLHRKEYEMRHVIGFFALGLVLAGCGQDAPGSADDRGDGSLAVALTTTAADGTTYTLTGATLDLTGAATVSTTLDGTTSSITVLDLPQGFYQAALGGAWTISRDNGDGTSTAVQAVLASSNPASVYISPGETTYLAWNFLIVDTNGDLMVQFTVSTAHRLAGTLWFYNLGTATDGTPFPGGTFDPLVGTNADYGIYFAWSYDFEYLDASNNLAHTYYSGPVFVTFTNDETGVLASRAAEMTGQTFSLTLTANPDGTSTWAAMSFWGYGTTESVNLTFDPFSLPLTLDAGGYPVLEPGFSLWTGTPFDFDRYEGAQTDRVEGFANLNFRQ